MGNEQKASSNINFPNINENAKNQYFYLLSQSFIKHQEIVNTYQPNLKLSFTKNFKNTNNLNKNKIRINIGWKEYLINFFKKQIKNGHEFYLDIINEVNEEKFGFENQYLSFMFLIDYENTYNSKNDEIHFKKYINDEELDYEKQLKNRLSRNSSVDYTSSASKRSRSIIDLPNIEDEEKENEIKLGNTKVGQNNFRKEITYLVKIIKSQIEQKNHPINIIISIFEKHISSLIDDLLEPNKGKEKEADEFIKNIEKYNNTIIKNIQKFSSKIHTATKLFYSKAIHLDCFSEERDELINVIMSIIFNTGKLAYKIYYLFNIQYNKDIEDFKNKLDATKNLKPKDIQIDDRFCLDENTDKLIKKLKTEKEKTDNNANISEDRGIFDFLFNKTKKNNTTKINKYEGYNTAIQILKNKLPKIKSPYKKMLLIASISTEITECVDNYWVGTDEIIPSSNYLQVNSDELLKIFIFIVAHLQFPELIIHEKIVKNFTFNLTKNSMIGYYNTTLDIAIDYIQNKLTDDVKIGITEEYRKSIIGSLKLSNNKKTKNEIPKYANTKLYDSIDEDMILIDTGGNEIEHNDDSINMFNIASSSFNERNSNTRKYNIFEYFKSIK